MNESEPILADIAVSQEVLEKYPALVQAAEDFPYTIEWGETRALQIENVDFTEWVDDDALALKIILHCVFEEIGFDPADPVEAYRENETRFFKTDKPNILISYDGADWCLVGVQS